MSTKGTILGKLVRCAGPAGHFLFGELASAWAFACLLFWFAPTSAAQTLVPRESVLIPTTNSKVIEMDFASQGDVIVATFFSVGPLGSNPVETYVSDGRGLVWSGPFKASANATRLGTTPLLLSGDEAYVVWVSDPNGARGEEAFFDISPTAGSSWGLNRRVPTGFGAGNGQVLAVDAAVEEVNGTDHLAFLISFDPTAAGGPNWLLLTTSIDGGQSFQATTNASATNGAGTQPSEARVLMQSGVIHVVWIDRRTGTGDVYYQRSDDGGATFLAADVLLDSSGVGVGDATDFAGFELQGNDVLVAWREIPAGGGGTELRATVSTDGGQTFPPDALVIDYAPAGVDSIGEAQVGYFGGALLSVARTVFDDTLVTSFSSDDGASWSAPTTVVDGVGFISELSVVARGTDIYCSWIDSFSVRSTASIDAGRTWFRDVSVSGGVNVDIIASIAPSSYRNLVTMWSINFPDGPEAGCIKPGIGGYRPQAVRASGLNASSSSGQLHYTGFTPGSTLATTIVSESPGSFVLPDGRDLGIALDDLFAYSLGDGFSQFSALLDASGSGDSPPFAFQLIPGQEFYLVGLELDFSSGLTLGSLTDVQEVVVGN